ncbi:MAG: triphosphoribosyl-dephospho-CoA synthase CitG [Clostridia bacterium]|nr:triphosphoribosyl-dephospho-CoA synthase CitG [Clostridia bacterium]
MTQVTLSQMLDAREKRAEKQKNLLCRFNLPLISFTMNIAGPVKTSPLIERSFFEGVRLLKQKLPGGSIINQEICTGVTGCEAFFCVKCDPDKLKKICLFIEENVTIGRLFDMDVICPDGNKLERKNPRSCYVCGAPGRACSAGRVHSVDKLQNAAREIMENYFFLMDKEYCSSLAVKSLLDEVGTTPKPGLVDTLNSGSHNDMDIVTFQKSAHALKPYFGECFSIGKNSQTLSPGETFPLLQSAGFDAEKAMFNATGGVNTHKGIIYSMGVLCGSIGRLWRPETPFSTASDICRESAKIVKDAVQKDFDNPDDSTAGGRLYLKHGITGIRGEVASGFESVLKTGLPCYKKLISENFSSNDAGAITLLYLISNVKDTNLYNRGGMSGADFAQKITKKLLKDFPAPSKEQIKSLDDEFIKKNLSPGGCADLLAITYFLYNFET